MQAEIVKRKKMRNLSCAALSLIIIGTLLLILHGTGVTKTYDQYYCEHLNCTCQNTNDDYVCNNYMLDLKYHNGDDYGNTTVNNVSYCPKGGFTCWKSGETITVVEPQHPLGYVFGSILTQLGVAMLWPLIVIGCVIHPYFNFEDYNMIALT